MCLNKSFQQVFNNMDKIKFRCGFAKILTQEILYIKIFPNKIINLYDGIELMNVLKKLRGDKTYYHLVEMGEDSLFDSESRILFSKLNDRYADAIIVKSTTQRTVASHYIDNYSPVVKTKYFNKKSEGLLWIKELCENSL
jgi:hypothetical protein